MKFYDHVRTYVFGKYVRIGEINIREYISGVISRKFLASKYMCYTY